ncbi:hypothetical protein SAMN02745824_2361 [Parasphingorhabdus marina DSM 22363]|uniref:Uncharacterized protein n=1 Tax=Parasphingorhabdus marina DSM 22363 TaxID=1123272 RepID=A0A1N6FEH7_9SPHN|nr:hypothetical protein [Parasphingorhabdus marina]SIN93662.1 hypothetical protein SAMN02745824_2361 [Parasphingorhabdus marina DSM 22363]
MNSLLLYVAAFLALITMLIHSIVGEKRLISPLVNSNDGIMAQNLAKQVLRFAWHFMTLLGLIAVYVLFDAARSFPAVDRVLLLLTGTVFLVAGVYDAIVTRGKHIGWPFLAGIGVLTLIALYI